MKHLNKLSFLTLSILCIENKVLAGGYQLQEFSITNLGRSFAGAGIIGDDYSALAFNPAGMTLQSNGIQLGATGVDIHSNALNENSDPSLTGEKGKLRNYATVPHFFGQYNITKDINLGMGVYIPFGLGTYYNHSWFGKTHAIDSEIQAIDLAPAIAYKPTDWLSIGGSFIAEHLSANLTNNSIFGYSDMQADGWDYGWNTGIMITPTKTTRFGLSYRSRINHYIKGPHKFDGIKYGTASTTLNLPENIQFSALQKLGKFDISAMARWTKWNEFGLLNIKSTGLSNITHGYINNSTVDENWRNVWMFALGSDYHYNNNWTFRTGLAYDRGTVKDAEHRTARVPDANRWIASLGASYSWCRWQFDMGYSHVFWQEAKAHNSNGGTILDTTYKTQVNIFGLSAQYKF